MMLKNMVKLLKNQKNTEQLLSVEVFPEIGHNKFFLILKILIKTYFKLLEWVLNILLEFIPQLNMMVVFQVVQFRNQNLGVNTL